MAVLKIVAAFAVVGASLAAARAQAPEQPADGSAAQGQEGRAEDQSAEAEIDPDEMADQLNKRQQLRQTVIFTRTINGEVVGEEKRTLTYTRDDPVRPSEAGGSAIEDLRAAFDREVLTRSEAYEEARLDFAAADSDRDGRLTAEEFVGLVLSWRENAARAAPATDEEAARQRQFRAFVEELDPEAAARQAAERARERFAYMAGAAPAIAREDYIREYLLDFDAMDQDGDMILMGEELMTFRALIRGEALEE
ncbi:hypothetical protein [Amphiplicatus metriothermophilus]|uniref:EF-hand domain-containing protein n=1 Tax=Amphiplicatus metriothermophilus TaxID=1519374 RepID=A0A239PQA2_9PROT|nr:hypothetical protein [Amphiplicatus metriothermophilus]MBB5518721.1 hypothetical protein [Amphiplicatus metriothermophilus]SNT72122.1 hypothetical protein SAMN06297382_1154 [Amphiplicatus metriothermophilus]